MLPRVVELVVAVVAVVLAEANFGVLDEGSQIGVELELAGRESEREQWGEQSDSQHGRPPVVGFIPTPSLRVIA